MSGIDCFKSCLTTSSTGSCLTTSTVGSCLTTSTVGSCLTASTTGSCLTTSTLDFLMILILNALLDELVTVLVEEVEVVSDG